MHTLLLTCCLLLLQNKSSEYCAPLTSFDWNETDTKILGTSSIDTTCTIWELQVKHTPINKHPPQDSAQSGGLTCTSNLCKNCTEEVPVTMNHC